MSYIPVGTTLVYNAQVSVDFVLQSLDTIIANLSNQLRSELPGAEELDVISSSSKQSVFGQSQITLQVLNNGVDHSDENDIASIITGVLQNDGVQVVGSNISSFTLPNNPGDDTNQGQTIGTGATQAVALPSTQTSSSSLFSNLKLPSLGTTGTLTTGFVILIVLIVALILLLPSGFGKALRAVR